MNTKKMYHLIMLILYGTGTAVCFICNLLIDRKLSWFYIVFCSVLIAFSITNLPFLLKKCKTILPAVSVTLLTCILLYTCNLNVQGDWLYRYAYPIAAYPILLAWAVLGICMIKKWNWIQKSAPLALVCSVALGTVFKSGKQLYD